MMASDTFKMAYKPIPDLICQRYSPDLIHRHDLDNLLNNNHSTNGDGEDIAVSMVTFANKECHPGYQRPVSSFSFPDTLTTSLGQTDAKRDRRELRSAIARLQLTDQGVSYMLPANQSKISINNVYKLDISKAFDKEIRTKERSLVNHRPGTVSVMDTPRHCADVSALRRLNCAYLDNDPHAHRTLPEFMKKSRRAKHIDVLHIEDICNKHVDLPGSSLPDRGPLRRRWMAINPKVKDMVRALGAANLQQPVPWPSEHQLETRPYMTMKEDPKRRVRSGQVRFKRIDEDTRKRVQDWVQTVKPPPPKRNELLQQAMTRVIARKWSSLRSKK
ncbi:uncharacterized protein [Amphiura filiformis]|uniref:uncharacterized protein n=1 Tax=Amphiura filiformis TaxID=82378 RepID=UPI003B21D30B